MRFLGAYEAPVSRGERHTQLDPRTFAEQGFSTSPAADAIARKHIIVVDDHPMSREGIVRWIHNEPDLDVCCEAQTAAEALNAVIAIKPDLVLTDITLPGKSGLELIKDIHAIAPALRHPTVFSLLWILCYCQPTALLHSLEPNRPIGIGTGQHNCCSLRPVRVSQRAKE